jgi:hypothetical protein
MQKLKLFENSFVELINELCHQRGIKNTNHADSAERTNTSSHIKSTSLTSATGHYTS